MRKFLAFILCAAILLGLAGCGSFEDVLASAVKYAESNTAQYNSVLTEAAIVHMSPIFGTNVASYVKKEANGNIFCADYVYKNDVVSAWAETTYIPIAGGSDADIQALEQDLRNSLADLEALDFCTLKYERGNNYFVVTCVLNDVDKEANYNAIYQAGLSTEKSAISMKATEDLLLERGCFKK